MIDEVVDRDDVRMIQRREHPRLGEKTGTYCRIGAEGPRELLDRDHAAELSMAAGEHDAAWTVTQLTADLVGRQRGDDAV